MANTKLTPKSMVKIVNNCQGGCSFRDINGKKQLFIKKDAFKNLEMSIVEGLFNECEAMITLGKLVFPDKRVYEYLGVDEEVYSKFLTTKDIDELLDSGNAEKIGEALEEAPLNIKENVVASARKKGVDSKRVTKVIEEKTGFSLDEEEALV